MNDLITNFWERPPVEYRDGAMQPIKGGRGRTEAELDAWEAQLGVKLPALYREQFKIQNGGYPAKTIYYDPSGETLTGRFAAEYAGRYAVFVNDSHLMPMVGQYYSFREDLEGVYDEDEIAKYFPGWNLDKLIVISYMWGHSLLMLDYGYRGKDFAEPQLVCIETDEYTEELRVSTYELFVARLTEDDEED